jgi:hypothetical protein
VGGSEDEGQVDVLLLGVAKILPNLEQFGPAHHLINCADSEFCHDGTQLVGDVVEKVDHVLWLALKLLAELRILSSDANGTYNATVS